jgi:methyl-accepting chemotaxis protein
MSRTNAGSLVTSIVTAALQMIANVTDGIATQSAGEAIEGSEAVRQTGLAMKQIAQKIRIFDEIAYQTNLLALNAAFAR